MRAMKFLRTVSEQIDVMRSMTSLDEPSLFGGVGQAKVIKAAYESYWDNTIFRFLQGQEITKENVAAVCRQASIHELLYGSAAGARLRARTLPNVARYLVSKLRDNRSLTWDQQAANNVQVNRIECGTVETGSLAETVARAVEVTVDALRPYVDGPTLIVDLGSGWGRLSVAFCIAFPSAHVIAAEYTEAGRRSTALLAESGRLPITSVPFDYYNHSEIVSLIAASPMTNVVVTSSCSIEQIPYLSRALHDDLIALDKKRLAFVHIEPVGWQILGAENDAKKSRPPAGAPFEGYNRNLYLLLLALHHEGKVEIDRIEPNYFVALNVWNSASLLAFRAAGLGRSPG